MYKIVICLFILCSGIVRGFAADLPVLYITTPDGSAITSKEEWREGCRLRIVLPDGTTAYDSDKAALKGRGHSTFTKPKKPFAIKLDEKSGLLGMEKGKRWVLLANFMDHSLLRNKLAFSIARQTSLAWTPDSRFVDVVVNGKPQGCYLLCEQIRVNENRVNIDEKEGYLLEADAYLDEKNHFYTPRRHLPVNMKEPGDAQQLPYIQPKSVIRISQCCMAMRNPLISPRWTGKTALFLKTLPDRGYACPLFCPNKPVLRLTRIG